MSANKFYFYDCLRNAFFLQTFIKLIFSKILQIIQMQYVPGPRLVIAFGQLNSSLYLTLRSTQPFFPCWDNKSSTGLPWWGAFTCIWW